MSSPSSLTITNNSASSGEVEIAWTDAGQDGDWLAYRLYVRESGTTRWILAHEATVDAASFSYDLYQFAANVTTDVAVVEVTQDTSLEKVEGVYNVDTFSTAGLAGYYLSDPSDASKNFYLNHVTADPSDEQWEETVINLIGRGRKVDRGTRYGVTGSLSCQLYPTSSRTTRQQWNEIVELRQAGCAAIFIRSPFGDVWKVSITGTSRDRRAGVGLGDYMDVTISFVEVA
jgi:hypothetical protein